MFTNEFTDHLELYPGTSNHVISITNNNGTKFDSNFFTKDEIILIH